MRSKGLAQNYHGIILDALQMQIAFLKSDATKYAKFYQALSDADFFSDFPHLGILDMLFQKSVLCLFERSTKLEN